MSWSINTIGSAKAVAAEVQNNQYIPQGLKDVVNQIAAAPNAPSALHVESCGHTDSTYGGSVHSFTVKTVTLAPEPAPTPTPPTPPETAQS